MKSFTQFVDDLNNDPFLALRFRQDSNCRAQVLDAKGYQGEQREQALAALACGEETGIAKAFGSTAPSYNFVIIVLDSQQPAEVAA
jgi:hypothetical protein